MSSSWQDSETEQQEVSEVWTSVASLAQACIIQFSARRGGIKHRSFPLCCLIRNRLFKVTFDLVRKRAVSHFLEAEESYKGRNLNSIHQNKLHLKNYCLNSRQLLGSV